MFIKYFLQFGSVAEQASNLAHIPQTFDLELYAEHRLQKVRSRHQLTRENFIDSLSLSLSSILKLF